MNHALGNLAQAALNEELKLYSELKLTSEDEMGAATEAHELGLVDTPRTLAAQWLIAAGTAMLREGQLAVSLGGMCATWPEMLEEYGILMPPEHVWSINALRDYLVKEIQIRQDIINWQEQVNT